MATDISKIRNVGFAGHGGVGKTSVAAATAADDGCRQSS